MVSARPIPLTIASVGGHEHLSWADGLKVCLPRQVLEAFETRKHLYSGTSLHLPPELPLIDCTEAKQLRLLTTFTHERPVSARLPISYQMVPPRLRSIMASMVGRLKRRSMDRWAAFPSYPLDLSADFLWDLAGGPPSPFADGATPVLLSHDLDSLEGLENAVKLFLDLEEAVDAHSSNYVVPCAWPIDHGRLTELSERGHEVGIHGYDHSNLTPFLDDERRRTRLEAAGDLIERYKVSGYRAPSLLRTPELLRSLAALYRYDSSVPTSGGLFPVPNNGCASARPFEVERIWEIPLSLPRDGSLRFLGYSPEYILKTWIDCADQIASSGGVVVLLTHCEARFSGNTVMLEIYKRFLDYVATSDRFVWSTPARVLHDAGSFNSTPEAAL